MIRKVLLRFRGNDDHGASAVEYGLLLAAVAALLAGLVFGLGGTLASVFERTSSCYAASNSAC